MNISNLNFFILYISGRKWEEQIPFLCSIWAIWPTFFSGSNSSIPILPITPNMAWRMLVAVLVACPQFFLFTHNNVVVGVFPRKKKRVESCILLLGLFSFSFWRLVLFYSMKKNWFFFSVFDIWKNKIYPMFVEINFPTTANSCK